MKLLGLRGEDGFFTLVTFVLSLPRIVIWINTGAIKYTKQSKANEKTE